ncbi:hypothetical protein V5F77_00070 [Xanthobacter sp. DSM 24535]|uniref:O-antigen ligase family protein n=1 Tax=Roseixanthobacter psychrophilus TaxID=3119917 RepID=UPI003729C48E
MNLTGAHGLRRERLSPAERAASPARLDEGERFPPHVTWTILLCTLPMFGQCFHYYNELPPTYLLSKAWPILTLPLTIYTIAQVKLPAKGIYLIFLAYALGLTPLISIIHLGNDFIGSIATTVKIWPITYYFGLFAMLLWLAPTDTRTRAACITLGYSTYGIMLMLWLVIPPSWYNDDSALGKLLLNEQERGNRIYMPMFFGILLLFYLVRSFMQKPQVWKVAAVIVGFILMLWIYKQRTAIAAALLICGYGIVASSPDRIRRLFIAVGCVLAPIAAVAFFLSAGNVTESLGNSLSVRQNSLNIAIEFLGDNPLSWLFGVGATTRFGTVTLSDIFQDRSFFIADLGWAGEIFEYGLVGALLIFILHAWGFFAVHAAARRSRDPFAQALGDYILYLFATSAVYPLVFTPGEVGVVMAVGVYLDRYRKKRLEAPPQGPHLSLRTARKRVTVAIPRAVRVTRSG